MNEERRPEIDDGIGDEGLIFLPGCTERVAFMHICDRLIAAKIVTILKPERKSIYDMPRSAGL